MPVVAQRRPRLLEEEKDRLDADQAIQEEGTPEDGDKPHDRGYASLWRLKACDNEKRVV